MPSGKFPYRASTQDEEARLIDRDYSIGGGVSMVRRDFEHGFGEASKGLKNQEMLKGDQMKKISEVMSTHVTWATPETSLVEIAQLMMESKCGEIPLVSNSEEKVIVGVITDRDIVCRSLSKGINPMELKAKDCMTPQVIMADREMTITDAVHLMKKNKIRRIPVVDKKNKLIGIVSEVDLGEHFSKSTSTYLPPESLHEGTSSIH